MNERIATLKKVEGAITTEIEWCENNRGGSGDSEDYERGFMKGLAQARDYIVAPLREIEEELEEQS